MPLIEENGARVTIDGATWESIKTLLVGCHAYDLEDRENVSSLRKFQEHGANIYASIRPQVMPWEQPDERPWGVKIVDREGARWYSNERHGQRSAHRLARHYNRYDSERFGERVRYEAHPIGEDESY